MLALKRNLRLSDLSFFTSASNCQCQTMYTFLKVKVKVAQSCPILCDPRILQARILEWVANHSLLQEFFPTQGWNGGLPHCKRFLYQLSHQGSPRTQEWVALSLLQQIFLTQESNQGLLHCRQILYQLSHQGSPVYEIVHWLKCHYCELYLFIFGLAGLPCCAGFSLVVESRGYSPFGVFGASHCTCFSCSKAWALD